MHTAADERSSPSPAPPLPAVDEARCEALRRRIGQRFALKHATYELAGAPLTFYNVRDPDALIDLIDDEEFLKDERMPYWAEVWPAGLALSAHLLSQRPLPAPRCIELGAGVGLCGVAAAAAGARVLATDYFPEALDFVALNAAVNGVAVETALLDFRDITLPDRYDLLLASDVLYERRNHQPVLAAILKLLSPGGVAYLSDPQRLSARAFLDLLDLPDGAPLARQTWTVSVPQAGQAVPVDIHALRWR